MARLKSEIRVAAMMRQAQTQGGYAALIRRGDADAGAIWVVMRGNGGLVRYSEQTGMSGAREWFALEGLSEAELTLKLNRAVDMDPDLWVIEIENADGAACLDGPINVPAVESAAQSAAKAVFRDR